MRLAGLAAFVVMVVACDGSRPSRPEAEDGRDRGFDLGAPVDGARPDTLRPDAAQPDAAPPPDAEPDAPDAAFTCPPFAGPPPTGEGLPDLRVQHVVSLGAPPGRDALWAGELDGDGATPEVAVIRGGRLEVASAAGGQWWRSAVLDLQRIVGPADLDGDGRLELVAAARRSVHVFDGLTGAMRWSLPEVPFDGLPVSGIGQVRLLEAAGQSALYVTDSGCGDEGSGRGVFFDFAGGFEAPRVRHVDGPRLNGRCTRWQTLADLDGDGAPELLVNDGDGLNGFDRAGHRRWCGRFAAPPNGPLPHIASGRGWFVSLPGGIGRVVLADDAACEGGLVLADLIALDGVRLAGSVVADGALLTSRVVDGAWQVIRVGDDGAEPLIDGARLLGAFAGGLLVAIDGGPAPDAFGGLQLYVDGAARWPLPIPRARPLTRPGPADRTPEFEELLTLDGDLVVLRAAAEDETVDRIERIRPDGTVRASHALEGTPGAIRGVDGGLVVAEAGGVITLLDGELRPRFVDDAGRSPIRAAAGAPRLAAVSDGEQTHVAAAVGDIVALLEPDRETTRWQTAIGTPLRGGSPLRTLASAAGADGLLVRDARAGDAAWAALDGVDGRRRWRHRLDPALFRPVGDALPVDGPDGVTAVVARADLVLQPDAWARDDAACGATIFAHPEPTAPAEQCPGFAVKPRVVRGLDPQTGRCRWRLVLRPRWPCGGPSNQTLSTADADGDGRPELYLTESDAIRRIDPLDGALLDTVVLDRHASDALRGGGWMRAADGIVLRVGGNGPVEAFDAALQPLWRAPHPEGLRLQTWIGRDAALLDGAVWLVPAAAHPLQAWHLADGAPRASWGIVEGRLEADAPFEAAFADLRGLRAVADIDGAGRDGLLATDDDGTLYGLTARGLAWSRPHDAAIGAPLVTALQPDAPRALLVPTADGRILIYGPRGPAAPPAAWDLPCPAQPSCDADDDIDRTETLDRLCAAWVPVRGAQGYEVRPLGPNGAQLGPWRAVPQPPATLDGVALVPGVRYAVEVRTVADVAGQPRRSAGRATDGVDAINDPPPIVELAARPDALTVAEQPVVITVAAADDDRLAGWRLSVIDADDRTVRRLAGGPLASPRFDAAARWNLEDDGKRPVEPGTYRIVATVVDRAGHAAWAEAPVEVCDGACR